MRIHPDPDGDYRRRSLRRPRRRAWWRRVIPVLLVLMGLSILPVLALRWLYPPITAFMIAEKLNALTRGETLEIRYLWIPRAEISPYMGLAVIAAEDQRFTDHWGFDFGQIEAALAARKRGLRGASTLSQQVAKNLFLWSGRSWWRKGLEAWFTLWIEGLWDKQRILEVYLNVAQFGRGLYGVEAASRHYFNTGAKHLTATQAARLAAVLPNPLRYAVLGSDSSVAARRHWIEIQMRRIGGVGYLRQLRW
jgi:monofunctional glycosyltransferase